MVVQTSTQERLNALQDELDRILSAKKDITKLAEFDLDALVHLLSTGAGGNRSRVEWHAPKYKGR